MQEPRNGRHPGVVEVVLVEVEVVGAGVVVVVCAWQVPPEQMPLQHWWFFLHFFPVDLDSLSVPASPMPSDPKRAPDGGGTHQPERLASRDAAAGHLCSQRIEGTLSCFW